MSFVPVNVLGTMVNGSGIRFDLPKPVGVKKAFLGLRPEVLGTSGDGPTVTLKVDVAEMLGSDQYLYGKMGDDDVIARVDPGRQLGQGDSIALHVDLRRIHLFDAETEQAVTA